MMPRKVVFHVTRWTRRCRTCKDDFGYLSSKPTGPYRCPQCNRRCVTVKFGETVAVAPARGDGIMSEGGFTPHFNQAFGCHVESPQHLRHLDRVHGTREADTSEQRRLRPTSKPPQPKPRPDLWVHGTPDRADRR